MSQECWSSGGRWLCQSWFVQTFCKAELTPSLRAADDLFASSVYRGSCERDGGKQHPRVFKQPRSQTLRLSQIWEGCRRFHPRPSHIAAAAIPGQCCLGSAGASSPGSCISPSACCSLGKECQEILSLQTGANLWWARDVAPRFPSPCPPCPIARLRLHTQWQSKRVFKVGAETLISHTWQCRPLPTNPL